MGHDECKEAAGLKAVDTLRAANSIRILCGALILAGVVGLKIGS